LHAVPGRQTARNQFTHSSFDSSSQSDSLISGSYHESDCFLAKTNYQYEKRRRELAKKKKKEEKRQKKLLKGSDTDSEDDMLDGDDADDDDPDQDKTIPDDPV
jgi:hypothetical protein